MPPKPPPKALKTVAELLGLGTDVAQGVTAVADAVNAREGLAYNTLAITADAVDGETDADPGTIDFDKPRPSNLVQWDALLDLETAKNSRASFGVQLLTDGRNIVGGLTFLSSRVGYSKFGDQAGVEFSGTPLRVVGPPRQGTNVFVAHYLLIATGFQNPQGEGFQDFCVAIVLRPDKRALPIFKTFEPKTEGDVQQLGDGATRFAPLLRIRAKK